MTKQFNARLPELSHDQIDDICEIYGLTKTQVLIIAIDRLHTQLQSPEIRYEMTAEDVQKAKENEPDGILPADYFTPIEFD